MPDPTVAAPVDAGTTTADASAAAETKTSDTSVADLAMQDITLDDDSAADDAADDNDEGHDDDSKADDNIADDDDTDASDADDPAANDDDSKDDKPTRGEQRKDELNTEIRDLVQTRNELRKQVAEVNDKVYAPHTQEELLDEVNPDTGEMYTPLEAKVKAMEESEQVRQFNDQVAEAQLQVHSESARIIADFPMFDEKSPEYKKEIAGAADEIFALNLVRDPNTEQVDDKGNKIPGSGQIIGTHLPVYKIYKLIADAAKLATTDGQIQGQKAVKKMIAAADTVSGNGPKTTADKGVDAFDKEFDKYS